MAIACIRGLAAASAGFAIALVLATGCASSAPETAATVAPAAPPPAAEIYAAVIGKHFQPKPGQALRIVSTLRGTDRIEAVDHPLYPRLVEAGSHPMSVPEDLPAPLPYEVLSEGELEAARRNADGGLVGSRDDELVSFSAIGFDPAGQRALVYVEWHCGSECGGGGFYELERRGNHWQTVQYIHRISY
jgi:hypothetical protein